MLTSYPALVCGLQDAAALRSPGALAPLRSNNPSGRASTVPPASKGAMSYVRLAGLANAIREVRGACTCMLGGGGGGCAGHGQAACWASTARPAGLQQPPMSCDEPSAWEDIGREWAPCWLHAGAWRQSPVTGMGGQAVGESARHGREGARRGRAHECHAAHLVHATQLLAQRPPGACSAAPCPGPPVYVDMWALSGPSAAPPPQRRPAGCLRAVAASCCALPMCCAPALTCPYHMPDPSACMRPGAGPLPTVAPGESTGPGV
jgi:hypothetical protein